MNAIQFKTIIGPDGVIHPPAGVELPEGEIEVSVRSASDVKASLEIRARELAARRGLNWDTLPEDMRAIFIKDVQYEDRGLSRPRPGPGACKGMILYMAPDFDAPLEDMKEYME
jgi:hypothetical protein